jgi:hypothetical protein
MVKGVATSMDACVRTIPGHAGRGLAARPVARPKHGTAQWPPGLARLGPKDQDVPEPPPRPMARHGHGPVPPTATRLVRQA